MERFDFRPSTCLILVTLLVHLGSIGLLLFSQRSLFGVGVLALLIVAHGIWLLRQQMLRDPWSPLVLVHDADGWQLHTREHGILIVERIRIGLLSPRLLTLRLYPAGRSIDLTVCADALSPPAHRRLRILVQAHPRSAGP